MKITEKQLRRIIREELQRSFSLNESLEAIESEIRQFHREEIPAHSAAQSLDYYSPDKIRSVLDRIEADEKGLRYYAEEILSLIEDPQSSSEYLYGEPDRGAGSRRYRW